MRGYSVPKVDSMVEQVVRMKLAEIAAALDMNANTVKTRLRRGRARLREELTKGED